MSLHVNPFQLCHFCHRSIQKADIKSRRCALKSFPVQHQPPTAMDTNTSSLQSAPGRLRQQSNPTNSSNRLPVPSIANPRSRQDVGVTQSIASSHSGAHHISSPLTTPPPSSLNHSGDIQEAPMNLQSQPPDTANSNDDNL